MSITVGPVTIGGTIRSRILAGIKEIKISKRAQAADVPMIAPYPWGQASLVPVGLVGQ